MLLWECSGLQPWDRRYKKGLEILHRPTPPVCLSSVSCRHTHDQISQVFSVHIWIPQTIKSGGDEGLRMRQRSAIFPHFWYTTSNQKLETKAVWEQKLTLRKYSYWGSFCSILIIAVDSKEGEVVMQSLLNLVLMSPHVRANTQRASGWILRTAADAVLVNAACHHLEVLSRLVWAVRCCQYPPSLHRRRRERGEWLRSERWEEHAL